MRGPTRNRPGVVPRWLVPGRWIMTLLLVLLLAPATVRAQGQVTMLTISNPDPMQTQMMPLRTSRDFFVIQFSHNGGSGSYFVNTMGADIEGSTFDGGPNQTVTEVAAGFDTDGVKQINLVLFQTRFNITFQTTNATNIQFDSTPPNFTVQRLVLNPMDPPTPFAAGTTFFTSNPQFTVEGTTQDPDNGSPSSEITFMADVDGTPSMFTGDAMNGGTFSGTVDLGQTDGEKLVRLTAQDAFPMDAMSLPNVSQAFQFRVVLDTQEAAITNVTIIRDPGDPATRVELPAGGQTFIGRSGVQIRVEFSEPLRMQPDLRVTQNNGQAILASPLTGMAVENRIFFWSYTAQPQDDQNGPAVIDISGILDRAGNETTNDPMQTLDPAFRVDTIPPVRIRFAPAGPGDTVSNPADGARIGENNFPRTIQAFVEDYDNRDPASTQTTNASGVRFAAVERSAPGMGMNPRALTIRLLPPGSAMGVPGSPSLSPPNGVFLTLPSDFDDPGAGIPGFQDVDNDGIAEPIEGVWRIEVGIQDQVGNTMTEVFQFTVDTTPIQANTLIVDVQGPSPTPNPLMTGVTSCWGGPDMRTTSVNPTITVSSTDPMFSTTRSRVQFLSQIGGPNSQPVQFDASVSRTAAGIQLTDLRQPGMTQAGDSFPVPDPPPGDAGLFLPPGTLDPRLGISDGIHLVRVFPVDSAGNEGVLNGARTNFREFAEFQMNLDTITPTTRRTFPEGNTAINEPLRFVDAIVVDPAAPNGNAGCGIDVNRSILSWTFESAYQPNNVDATLLDSANGSVPAPLRGTLRFIHMPNSTDPTLPSFNPNDDAFRVLLELTDANGFVRTLPRDGTMDGIYSIVSRPVDQAGNQIGEPGNDNRGDYFGLRSSNTTTRNLARFNFLYDSVDPTVEVTGIPEGGLLSGPTFNLRGSVQDLSAQSPAAGSGMPTQGGSGIDRVEVLLEVVDINANPIPNDPASPGKRNPVIALTRATLSPLLDPANDPTRTVTMPLDASFAMSTRERRDWNVALDLPEENRLLAPRQGMGDFYQLTVRAFDRAGNERTIRRRVTISLAALRPPTLTAPRCGAFINRPSVTFEWSGVVGAVRYRFELTDPDGAVVARDVNAPTSGLPMTMANLTKEGRHSWRVASIDAAGNTGSFSNPCPFTYDRTRPRVLTVVHTDPVEPNPNSGTINTGRVRFTLTFSEDLDTSAGRGVEVSLDPKGAIGVAPQRVTTSSFDASTWVGELTIPADANPSNWDGVASLQIRGAQDLAGNPMNPDLNRTVEIDTGPFFTTRFFLSPLNEREITVAILSSEDLIEPPTLTNIRGAAVVDFQGSGASPRAKPVSGSPRSSYITLRLQSSGRSQVAFDLTGQDLSLNGAKRAISFEVIPPTRESQSAVLASGMRVAVGAMAIGSSALYVFPSIAAGGTPEALEAAADQLAEEAGGGASPELEELGFPETLGSLGQVVGALSVEVPVAPMLAPRPDVAPGQVGLYQLSGGRWRWRGGVSADGIARAQLGQLQPLMVAADPVPPRAEPTSHQNGTTLDTSTPEVTWRVADDGSGVDLASIQVLVDEGVVPHRFDPQTQEVKVRFERDLPPGTHRMSLALKDNAGNELRTATLYLTAPDGFGFSDPPVAVPNPARTQTAIRFDLTQPGATTEVVVEIYDTAGHRVRTLRQVGGFAARDNRLAWDLRSARGAVVSNGVYLFRCHVRGPGHAVTTRGKIAVLR